MSDPDSDDVEDERIGSVLDGRYRILHRLSAGSMGVVYRGERVPVGKPVAVKFLHAAFAADPEFLQRFERETRVMSKLGHPHCVSVLDFGIDRAPYMVMDFVMGTTLRHIIDEESPLPWPEALALARQLLAGLAHAHQQGIVHRDVKPANIMVSEEIGTGRHVRVLDFGLARLRGSSANSVTQSCVVVGTPNYMAPEQTVAADTDARTDLYAAGIILFEMLTGGRPFSAVDTMELFHLHRTAPVPRIRDAAPGVEVPSGVDAVLRKALAKDPRDRYASAVEFAEALDAIALQDASLGARSSSQVRRQPSPAAPPPRSVAGSLVAMLVLAGGVAAALILALRPDDRAARTRPGGPPPAASGTELSGSRTALDPGTAPPAIDPPGDRAPSVAAAPAEGTGELVAAGALADGGALVDDAGTLDAVAELAALDAGAEGTTVTVAVTTETVPAPAPGGDLPSGAGAGAASESDAGVDDLVEPGVAGEPEGESEAADAPATAADAEAREAAQKIAPARSLAEAMAMIKRGQREPALLGLRALWNKAPRSANLPYLMGNLYFDKKWWSVAIDHYQAAIARAPAYKRNSILIRNVIHTLGSGKTRGKASWFLVKVVGRSAKPYLQAAARRDPSPAIRRSAAWLNKKIR